MQTHRLRPGGFLVGAWLTLLLFQACSDPLPEVQPSARAPHAGYVSSMEAAHEKELFTQHEVVSFDIILNFGGRQLLDARLHLATNSSAARLDLGKRTIWVVGDKVYSSDQPENPASIRFSAYTWSYFFLMPYKLSDPGTRWEAMEGGMLDGQLFDSRKLLFEDGTGDAPEDWYITFADKNTRLLYAAPYIVTGGGSVEEAEEDPHSIRYEDYRKVEGVPLAHRWTFFEWREGQGHTRQLGDARLSDFQFGRAGDLFSVPDSATFIPADVLDS